MEQNNSFLILFLAPVREYLENDDVSEVLINGPNQVYVETKGKLQLTPARFPSEQSLRAAASNIAKSVGRMLDDANPRLDARLPAGQSDATPLCLRTRVLQPRRRTSARSSLRAQSVIVPHLTAKSSVRRRRMPEAGAPASGKPVYAYLC